MFDNRVKAFLCASLRLQPVKVLNEDDRDVSGYGLNYAATLPVRDDAKRLSLPQNIRQALRGRLDVHVHVCVAGVDNRKICGNCMGALRQEHGDGAPGCLVCRRNPVGVFRLLRPQLGEGDRKPTVANRNCAGIGQGRLAEELY